MEKINSAVIGCGRMGAFTSESIYQFSPSCWLPLSHIEALKSSKHISLNAICDVNRDLLEKAKKIHGIEKTFVDYNELLAEIRPQLLCIATRTIERTDIIKAGIKAGVKAFHVEKPLCNSVYQVNELEYIIQQNNIALSYGAIRRHLSIYKEAKEIIDSGILGELQQIQINFGKGPLFWTHPHSVDLILFFAGDSKFLSAQAKLDNIVFGTKPFYIESDPMLLYASLNFEDNITGLITRSGGSDVILSCTKGELIIEANGRSIFYRKSDSNDPYYPYPGKLKQRKYEPTNEGSYSAINTLINAVKNNNKTNSQQDILLGQRILFLFAQSSLNNSQLLSINDLQKELFILAKTGHNVA